MQNNDDMINYIQKINSKNMNLQFSYNSIIYFNFSYFPPYSKITDWEFSSICEMGYFPLVEYILKTKKISISYSLLFRVIQANQPEVFKLLFENSSLKVSDKYQKYQFK